MKSSYFVLAFLGAARADGLATAGLATATAVALPQLTPCQQCCSPGGTCEKAYKGTPGKCCGTVGGQAFCCPGSVANPALGAKCYNCGDSYRCFSGFASRNICGPNSAVTAANMQPRGRLPPPEFGYGSRSQQDFTGTLVFMAIVGVFLVLFCTRRQADTFGPGAVAYGQPGAMQVPVGQPMPMAPVGHYPVGYGGYGGMSVAGSAATGFLGGMLVSDVRRRCPFDLSFGSCPCLVACARLSPTHVVAPLCPSDDELPPQPP